MTQVPPVTPSEETAEEVVETAPVEETAAPEETV